jgi:outer membrane protein insertion porin family
MQANANMKKIPRFNRFLFALIVFSVSSCGLFAQEQSTGFSRSVPPQNTVSNPNIPVPVLPTSTDPNSVLDVRITGNEQVEATDIIKIIKTRQGRPFSEATLEEDTRALIQTKWFIDVKPRVEKTPNGYIITYQFIERPLLHYTKIVGPRAHTKKVLLEEANIKTGDAQDPIAVNQAAERMEQYYRESGYHQVHVDILSGDELGDRGATFLISEGPKQRILSTEFEGNHIASGEHLKTLVQSKPGWFLWINSDFTRKKLDDDVETLTNYYRKLGFFYAKVDRTFEETSGYTGLGERRNWIKVKFIIDEGPRCKIREIRFIGNHVFDQAALLKVMKSAKNKDKYFNQDTLESDMIKIKEKYGDQGYVFAVPSPDPRIEQDYVDLVINVKEGPRCYLNTLSVEIAGNDGAESYTKWHPVLLRSSIKPGDILRTTEINATKRRLMASQLFNTNPTQGAIPEFIFDYPKEAIEEEEAAAEREAEEAVASGNPQIRGQAPEKKPIFLNKKVPYQPDIPGATAPGSSIVKDVYRGQAPAYYTPPGITGVNSYKYPGPQNTVPTQTTVTQTPASVSPMSFGSVAPSPMPLQSQSYPANYSTGSYISPQSGGEYVGNNVLYNQGMIFTQYRSPQTEMPDSVTILGNPYASLGEPTNVRIDPNAPPGVSPRIYPADGKIIVNETRTGQLMMSIAVSSDAGLMGRFVIEEQNFDILNFPKGFRFVDWKNAFRGKGQRFRIEAVPGTEVQRYSASWETPYLFDLDYSFGVSGFYYQRYYDEWYENRVGGSLSFGKLWTPDFSTRLSLGAQNVNIHHPMMPVWDLYEACGKHPMYTVGLDATHNTRDSEYMPTEGHLISAGVEQVFGDYQFVRGNLDLRQYFMLRERPDRSGRWVLGLRSSIRVTEKGTPIYERYFGGGFTSLRGFEFRGVSPRDSLGFILGGNMEFYNSAEMIFPLTADDMIRGSFFIDTGTVEQSWKKWESDYRVALGFGLRLTIPMMGPAPIALDFAFPISMGHGDDKQVFSFNVGLMR